MSTTPGYLTRTDHWLSLDPDDWTRHVLRRHFHPDHGSPYWLKRAADLPFDPLDITTYAELTAFGPFPLSELREVDPADLVPLAVPRPLAGQVWETGGTTGAPCRVFYTDAMLAHNTDWRCRAMAHGGFETGRSWLHAGPTGPHLIGTTTLALARDFAATVYGIDMDPRWVKQLIRAGDLKGAQAYTDHLLEQIADVLGKREVDYLSTTPALFQVLQRRHPDLVRRLAGARLGGTQVTPDMYREFSAALDGKPLGLTYGNTLGSGMGLPPTGDGALLPYVPPYPQVTIALVDKGQWTRSVDHGQIGRVRLTVLHEDLFLPNVLERDQGIRYDTDGSWPCDGVANVQPLQITQASPEGLY
jgi:hypothetical protein